MTYVTLFAIFGVHFPMMLELTISSISIPDAGGQLVFQMLGVKFIVSTTAAIGDGDMYPHVFIQSILWMETAQMVKLCPYLECIQHYSLIYIVFVLFKTSEFGFEGT
jgi:hypothetical protein